MDIAGVREALHKQPFEPFAIRLTTAHVDAAAETLALAFQRDPLMGHLLPDSAGRLARLTRYFACLVRCGLAGGEVYGTSPNVEGVAIWYSSGRVPLRRYVGTGLLAFSFTAGPRFLSRSLSFGRHLVAVRQQHFPERYRYLQYVGVRPEHVGKGFARRLLDPMLARVDHEKISCCVYTMAEEDLPFYHRFGFEVLNVSTIPRGTVRCWLLMRRVRG